jgi:hypothetical protein
MSADARLLIAYERMAALTAPVCGVDCGKLAKYRCCSPEYCEMAKEWSTERYGVTLDETGHETLPFMGPTGCSIAPHFRPLCTLHTCDVNSLGFKKHDQKWTDAYFKLRNEIEQLEPA